MEYNSEEIDFKNFYFRKNSVEIICYQRQIQNCSEPSRLLLINLDHVILLHLQSLGGFIIVDSTSVKQKPGREQLVVLLSHSQLETSYLREVIGTPTLSA